MIRTLSILLLLTSTFFACKEEQVIEDLPPLYEEYRHNVVGTYSCVCTRTHTGPWYPGFVSTTDTTNADAEIKVRYSPEDSLSSTGYGIIRLSGGLGTTGGRFGIYPKNDEGEYSFGTTPTHLGFNSGSIYETPDSMFFSHGWKGSPSNSAEYIYRCKGLRIQ